MAAEAIKIGTSVRLDCKVGVDAKGDSIRKNISFKVNPGATTQQLYDVFSKIGTLVNAMSFEMLKVDTSQLIG